LRSPGNAPRHQFDGGDAQLDQACQLLLDFRKTAERADVQLLDHRFVPRAACQVVCRHR
jgi:hypothetical protein